MSGKQTLGFNDPLQAETDYLLSLVLLHASYLCPLLFLNFCFLSFFGKHCVPILISGWIFLLFLWYERSFNEARTIVSNGTRAFIMQTNVCQLRALWAKWRANWREIWSTGEHLVQAEGCVIAPMWTLDPVCLIRLCDPILFPPQFKYVPVKHNWHIFASASPKTLILWNCNWNPTRAKCI